MSVFWSMYGFRNIQATADASQARAEARGARMDVREVGDQVERTLLVCEAMWSILRDRLGVTDEELFARVNEIDLSDGKLDGKVRKATVAVCSKCKRTVSKRFAKCSYCGHEIGREAFS